MGLLATTGRGTKRAAGGGEAGAAVVRPPLSGRVVAAASARSWSVLACVFSSLPTFGLAVSRPQSSTAAEQGR